MIHQDPAETFGSSYCAHMRMTTKFHICIENEFKNFWLDSSKGNGS